MNELTHVINLVMGDPSADGHRETTTLTIRSNLSKKEIEKAYKVGSKKLGIDFTSQVAEEYEDNNISYDVWKKLSAHGLTLEKLKMTSYDIEQANKFFEKEEGFNIWTDTFAQIYLFIVSLGNDRFDYVDDGDDHTIDIGGYGLFS